MVNFCLYRVDLIASLIAELNPTHPYLCTWTPREL